MAVSIPVSSDNAVKLCGTSTPARHLTFDITLPNNEPGLVYNAVMGKKWKADSHWRVYRSQVK